VSGELAGVGGTGKRTCQGTGSLSGVSAETGSSRRMKKKAAGLMGRV